MRSPRSAARIAPGSSARSVGFRSPASSVCHRPTAVRRRLTRAPSGPVTEPRSAARCRRRTSVRRSAFGLGRRTAARAAGAQLAQHARHRGERRPRPDVRSLERHDGVEHERRDAVRVQRGVGQRDARAVRDAVEHELARSRRRRAAPRCPARCRCCGRSSAARRASSRRRGPGRASSGPASPKQPSGPEDPVPRWSKTTRSRPASSGFSDSAKSVVNGSAACPGRRRAGSPPRSVGVVRRLARVRQADRRRRPRRRGRPARRACRSAARRRRRTARVPRRRVRERRRAERRERCEQHEQRRSQAANGHSR